jgi:hypothetical protein
MYSIDAVFSVQCIILYLRGPELLWLVLYEGKVQELGQQDLEGGQPELVRRIHVSLVLKGLCHEMNNFLGGLKNQISTLKKPSAPIQKVVI